MMAQRRKICKKSTFSPRRPRFWSIPYRPVAVRAKFDLFFHACLGFGAPTCQHVGQHLGPNPSTPNINISADQINQPRRRPLRTHRHTHRIRCDRDLAFYEYFGTFDSRFAWPRSEGIFFEICGTTRENEPLNAKVSAPTNTSPTREPSGRGTDGTRQYSLRVDLGCVT